MLLSILMFVGLVFFCLILAFIAIMLMPKFRPIPPHYDFSSDDEVKYLGWSKK